MAGKTTGKKSATQRGRELGAPQKTVTINGRTYALVFSNAAIRTAEDVYAEQYRKDVGFGLILKELTAGRYAAVMAILFGTLKAGGYEPGWETFDRDFRLDGIAGIREMIVQGIADSLPTTGGNGADPR